MRQVLGLAFGVALSQGARAQEAFKSHYAPQAIRDSWSVGLAQSQYQPVLSAAKRLSSTWVAAASYDFESVSAEASYFVSSSESSWPWGLTWSLVPELRSFSWSALGFVSKRLWRVDLTGFAGLSSLNAWGQGLWARDLKTSPTGRALVMPLQIQVGSTIDRRLRARIAFDYSVAIANASLKNKFGLLIGLSQGFE